MHKLFNNNFISNVIYIKIQHFIYHILFTYNMHQYNILYILYNIHIWHIYYYIIYYSYNIYMNSTIRMGVFSPYTLECLWEGLWKWFITSISSLIIYCICKLMYLNFSMSSDHSSRFSQSPWSSRNLWHVSDLSCSLDYICQGDNYALLLTVKSGRNIHFWIFKHGMK